MPEIDSPKQKFHDNKKIFVTSFQFLVTAQRSLRSIRHTDRFYVPVDK